jgi:hypothetical protein
MESVATCRLCTGTSHLEEGICTRCREAYGKRAAVFIARAQVDPAFANATLGRLDPVARERLLAVVSQRYLGPKPALHKAVPRAVTQAGYRRGCG